MHETKFMSHPEIFFIHDLDGDLLSRQHMSAQFNFSKATCKINRFQKRHTGLEMTQRRRVLNAARSSFT